KTETNRLKQFADTKIRRHARLKLAANPFLDRDYFLDRMNASRILTPESQIKLSFFSYGRPVNGL
ncbi:MAG: hypothetical protein PHF64_11745, partial [Methanoregula sp.]|nr:hypothetical protein [Methanoregula sp.]